MTISEDEVAHAGATTDGMGRRAVRNSLIVIIARIASRVIALVSIIVMTNYLTSAAFGEMQTVITYAALLNVALDLGYGTLYVREGARNLDKLSSYLGTLMTLKAATA